MVFFEKHGTDHQTVFRIFDLESMQFPYHFHRAYELIFVKSGNMSLIIDEIEYNISTGDVAFVFHDQLHSFQRSGDSSVVIIQFSPELVGDFDHEYQGLIPVNNILKNQFVDLNKLDSIYEQKSFIYEMCARLAKQTNFTAAKLSKQTRLLHQILQYLEENYAGNCELKSAASYLRYDYPYLSKLFLQLMNVTYTEYLNNYRISKACWLLRNSDQTISNIAGSCGYRNLRTFHRNFNRIMRQTPSQYRDGRKL